MSLCLGIGLSAACGFRIFVPLLVMSIAAKIGHLHLVSSFHWVQSDAALIAFSVATCLEIAGYYIPWFDHLLDVIAAPAAIVAGTIATASMVGDISPFLKWTLAIIAGGGAAGLVHATTAVVRGTSFVGTGGAANPVVSTFELIGSLFVSFLAIVAPFVAVAFLVAVFYVLLRKLVPRFRSFAKLFSFPVLF